ncbi:MULTISPECIES: FKBP-type peptidyl-prolyl cis-trans isomerase [Photobacterium]|uniref:Peptidyl-prolyl cis-trans isomerase n=2 Tax=Photobacterium TaxID=657 RepID=A0A1B8HXA0_9GAMM|nr:MULTISPECIES: FKBP-type peptidyl-prolyl cis-trans isomerase [Photobacterium]MCP4957033.1 FKBP-type peptidyl-prolyl cis-trans isomerase [Photobacterium aquimaris]OBU18229.1 peptidylprolyl isomerase [Photobacterium aquimaris]PQJ40270.1 peptidylprolyl isomerase [Photobacterium aquimaris]PSU05575.1 FKBP-type peptidyl-prolyl cis-trans isomerase [Photobacterium aquimaris]SMY17734.1 FKBP-type 16 kDa peptidyl-prolyl cis-trans isomerase [Photobacterium aquimaris]
MSVIKDNSEVLMHFAIKLADGSVAESTFANAKPVIFRMGDGSLTANFEKCLLGLTVGQKATFDLAPEDAFGPSNPNNIHHVDLSKFSANTPAEVGRIIAFTGPDGHDIPGIITQVMGESVTVDFNHPLAGKTVTFEVEVVSIER